MQKKDRISQYHNLNTAPNDLSLFNCSIVTITLCAAVGHAFIFILFVYDTEN